MMDMDVSPGNGGGRGRAVAVPLSTLASVECKQVVESFDRCDKKLFPAIEAALQQPNGCIYMDAPGFFKMQLERYFENASKQTVDDFLKGIEAIAADVPTLLVFLRPTLATEDEAEGMQPSLGARAAARYEQQRPSTTYAHTTMQQPSLMRMLVVLRKLQHRLVEILLQTCIHGQHDSSSPLPRLIISQLRFLDTVYDGPHLAQQFQSAIDHVSDPTVQSELIDALPSCIAREQHEQVSEWIRDCFRMSDELTKPALDALLHLHVSPALMHELVSSVMESLPSKPVDDLPVIVRFIVQASAKLAQHQQQSNGEGKKKTSKEGLQRTLTTLRQQLNQSMLLNSDGQSRRAEKSAPLLVLEVLRQAILCMSSIADVLMQVIREVNVATNAEQRRHQKLDVWILVMLHTLPTNQGRALNLLTKKVQSGAITIDVLENAIENHDIATCYFTSILQLCDHLVRHGSDNATRAVGAKLQSFCFTTPFGSLPFASPSSSSSVAASQLERSRLISQFISQISNSSKQESSNIALAELWKLVEHDPAAVRAYAMHLDALKDFLHKFEEEQMKCIYDILAALAVSQSFADGDGDGEDGESRDLTVDDKYLVLCNKQLSSAVPAHRKMGMIGCIALLSQLGRPELTLDNQTIPRGDNAIRLFKSHLNGMSAPMLKQLQNGQSVAGPLAFLYDELAKLVDDGCLHSSIVKTIQDAVEPLLLVFMPDWDGEENLPALVEREGEDWSDIHPAAKLGLSSPSDTGRRFLVSILPKLVHPSTRVQMPLLTPLVRLTASCHRALDTVDAIAAIPVAPIALCQPVNALDFREGMGSQAETTLIVSSFFHAENYLRELLSSFTLSDDDADHDVICTRLRHLLELDATFQQHLHWLNDPMFVPWGLTLEQALEEREDAEASKREREEKDEDGNRKKSKKKKAKTDPDAKQQVTRSQDHLFRPLQFSIFHLLRCPLHMRRLRPLDPNASISLSQTRSSQMITGEVKGDLSLEALRFLMQQLNLHIHDAVQCTDSPLVAARKEQLKERQEAHSMHDEDDAPLPISGHMNSAELLRALLSLLPHLGSHVYTIIRHLEEHPISGEPMADDDLHYAAPEVFEDCAREWIAFVKFMLNDPAVRSEGRNLREKAIVALMHQARRARRQADADADGDMGGDEPELSMSFSSQDGTGSRPGGETLSSSCVTLCELLSEIWGVAELNLQDGSTILQIMMTLHATVKKHEAVEALINSFASNLLRTGAPDKKARQIVPIVQAMLVFSDDTIESCHTHIDSILRFLKSEGDDDDSEQKQFDEDDPLSNVLSAATLPIIIDTMLRVLIDKIQMCNFKGYTVPQEALMVIQGHAAVMRRIVAEVATIDHRNDILKSIVKQGSWMLKCMVKNADVIRSNARRHGALVQAIMRDLATLYKYMMASLAHGSREGVDSLLHLRQSVDRSIESFQSVFMVALSEFGEIKVGRLKQRKLDGSIMTEQEMRRAATSVRRKKRKRGTARGGRKRKDSDEEESEEEEEESEEEEEEEEEQEEEEEEGEEEEEEAEKDEDEEDQEENDDDDDHGAPSSRTRSHPSRHRPINSITSSRRR